MPTQIAEIACAHSPDSDDAYMFYALATRKIRSPILQFRHVLDDIQALNQHAREGTYELTAISYHAYPYVADKYVLMAAGSSIGDGYGPMVVAETPLAVDDLKGKRILFPRSVLAPFDIVRKLRAKGTIVRAFALYTTYGAPLSAAEKKRILGGRIQRLYFKSPSGIHGFLRQFRAGERQRVLALPVRCIGETTAKAARATGFRRVSVL